MSFGFAAFYLSMVEVEHFIEQVKLNCSISDSRSWGFFSICGLLMRLRELYLNEHSLQPWESVPMEKITAWIQERENLWRELESEELHELVVDGVTHDPFDVNGLNAALRDYGLVYGSGYGVMGKPTFFVAELARAREIYDYCVYYAGRELCRDLAAYPAMLQGRCIYLRLDVLRTMLWDKFQTLKSGRHRDTTEEMFRRFGIGKNDTPSGGLSEGIERISRRISDLFVLHEIGEAFEDDHWEEWSVMIRDGLDKNTELYMRGVKDLLADTSEMGPLKTVIKEKDTCLLTAYASFLDGIRKEIFPGFAGAFRSLAVSGDWTLLENIRVRAHEEARRLRADLVFLWKDGRKDEIRTALRRGIEEMISRQN